MAESVAEEVGEVLTRLFWYSATTVLVAASLATVVVKNVTAKAVDAVTPSE